jgi:hypothetical protein
MFKERLSAASPWSASWSEISTQANDKISEADDVIIDSSGKPQHRIC